MSVDEDLSDGVSFMIKKEIRDAPFDKMCTGYISAVNIDGTYNVVYGGNTYTMPLYIKRELTVGQTIKFIYPQNQKSNAFIL